MSSQHPLSTNASSNRHTPWREFWAGVRDESPILLGVIPFGMIFGVVAQGAGLPGGVAQAMSSIIFAGSAQFIVAQLIGQSAPWFVIILTGAIVNLRHMLYSASISPHLRHLPARWKLLLSYLLTDEAYAVAILRFMRPDKGGPNGHWYLLGTEMILWTTWQASTAVGILLGALVPAAWALDFTLPLTFIAIVVPAINDRGTVAAAVVAGVLAVVAVNAPLKLGLLIAVVAGIAAGLIFERPKSGADNAAHKEANQHAA